MERKLTKSILNNLIAYGESCQGNYNIRPLKREEHEKGFHQWVDNKDIVGIVNISIKDISYYLVFIDWRMNHENYYIVALSQNRSRVLLELHKINKEYDSLNIEWRYRPSKRDGMNEERKECFNNYYGDNIKRIEVPNDVDSVEGFLDDIFDLMDKRIKSDDIIFKEELKMGFPEGKLYERVHKRRERNKKLIELVKKERLEKDKRLVCEICGFDFNQVYKELGKNFIEAHHIIPVSELKEGNETKKEDLVLVCSNCHSMLHRKRPWPTIDEIRKLIK